MSKRQGDSTGDTKINRVSWVSDINRISQGTVPRIAAGIVLVAEGIHCDYGCLSWLDWLAAKKQDRDE